MSGTASQAKAAVLAPAAAKGGHSRGLLQRKCACGAAKSTIGESCEGCQSTRLQRKLAIGATDDPLEMEADRVADQVLAARPHDHAARAPMQIQRATLPGTSDNGSVPESVDRQLERGGAALEPGLRRDMEQRFGHEFSRVRVHADAQAAQSASDVNARAYTVGNHVVFGAHQFSPRTHEGRRLLAHELTHVVQQRGSAGDVVRRAPEPAKVSPEPPGPKPFKPDPARRKDRRFAKQQAEEDVLWLQTRSKLSASDKALIMTRRDFFEDGAREIYNATILPMLSLAVQEETDMPLEYVGDVSNIDPDRRSMVRERRRRTARSFRNVKDYQLEGVYLKRLNEYLEKGCEENKDVDLEMLDQIIDERAPNAAWRVAAKKNFAPRRAEKEFYMARRASVSKLPDYWQNQFGALDEQLAANERMQPYAEYARSLLWMWHKQTSPYDVAPYVRDVVQAPGGEKLVMDELSSQFDAVLRDRNRAIQKECKDKPLGRLEKFWGDPCRSWYGPDSNRAEHEMHTLKARMSLLHDPDLVPYRDVLFLLKEYMDAADALPTSVGGAHLEILQAVSTVQGSMAMLAAPASNLGEINAAIKAQEALNEARSGANAAKTAPTVRAPKVPRAPVASPPIEPPTVSAPRAPVAKPSGPAPVPKRPGFFNRTVQRLYGAFGEAIDDTLPGHRDIAGGRIGNANPPAIVEKAPASLRAPAPTPGPIGEIRAPTPTVGPAGAVAEVRAPAPAPTATPAPAPTATPTTPTVSAPPVTAAPTPTPAPTVTPTVAPTSTPTAVPTVAPTVATPTGVSSGPAATIAAGHTLGTVTAPAPTNPAPSTSREVLLNLTSNVFHLAGSATYRKGVINGVYMSRADALARGAHQAGTPRAAPPSGVYSVARRPDGIEILAWIGERAQRAGFERELPSAAQYALAQIANWQRAHSTGAGLRIESEAAIRLASQLVNQIFQNQGIEDFLRHMRDDVGPDARLHLQTVTATQPRTLRLESIHYVVSLMEDGGMTFGFEVVIEMRADGSARAGVRLSGNKYVFGKWFSR